MPVSPGLAIEGVGESRSEPFGLWGRSFRPFFLAGAIFSALSVLAWAAVWLGALPAPGWLAPLWWHGHEMLFGFVAAAIAGFLLTAAPVWTGRPALCGRPLAALFALWVAGRVAFAAAGFVPAWLVATLDVAFLPAVAVVLARTLAGTGQRRNQALLGVLAALSLANAAMHAEALGLASGIAGRALRLAVDGVAVLIVVIAGRITPAFTRNAFRRRGEAYEVHTWPAVEALALGGGVALLLANLVAPHTAVSGALGTLAGLAVAVRVAGWRIWHTRSDPLLWSLHLGSVWVAVGWLLTGAGALGAPIPPATALHALTAGAMGATILAVMTRVGLGHTGRPLVLPGYVVSCYALVNLAALGRVAAPWVVGDAQRVLLAASALAWAAAFGLFALWYAPILWAPRPDGRPG